MRLFSVAKRSKYKQLFRERLTYKRWKAHAKMSKVIMGNGVFAIAWANLKLFQRGGRKQHRHMHSFFLGPCCWIILNLNQASQTLTTHNANRHCRVRFNTFVGQPLSKQLLCYQACKPLLKGRHAKGHAWQDVASSCMTILSARPWLFDIQWIVRYMLSTFSHWIVIYPVDQALSSLQTTGARFISL